MTKKLTGLRIDEISTVDAGAGVDVKVMLMKRAPVTGDELRHTIDEGVRRGVLRGGFEPPRNLSAVDKSPPYVAPRAEPPTYKREQEQPTMSLSLSRSEELHAIAKRHGAEGVAKHVIRYGPSGLSEFELTKMFTDGVPRQAGETPTRAFARAFSANNERGELMRRANAVVRDGQWLAKQEQTRSTNPEQWPRGVLHPRPDARVR